MSPINAYLFFDGNAAEAMRFYEKTLGGKLDLLMTVGESPDGDKLPPAMADRIIHARLSFGDGMLMASDTMFGEAYTGMQNFAVSLIHESVDEAQRVFGALADGGTVKMPFGKTFWVEAFGMVTDRFGTSWMINGGKPSA